MCYKDGVGAGATATSGAGTAVDSRWNPATASKYQREPVPMRQVLAEGPGQRCTRVLARSPLAVHDLQQPGHGVGEGDGFLLDPAERGGARGRDGVVRGSFGFGQVWQELR